MKNILCLVLALCMCLTFFTACNNEEDTPESVDPAGTYEIKVWVEADVAELTVSQIADFNQSNTLGIVINATVEALDSSSAAAAMLSNTGTGADIYCFTQEQTASLIRAGALSELDSAAADQIAAENTAGAVSAAKFRDSLWAYPLTADSGCIMYYDKTVVGDNHIDSLENIIADCEAAGRAFSWELEGSGGHTAAFFFATGCVSNWITDGDGNFTAVNDTFDSDAGVIACKGMLKLLSSGCYKNSGDISGLGGEASSAVVISDIYGYEAAKSILGDDLGVADLPGFAVEGTAYHLGSFSGCKLLGVKPQADARRCAALHQLALFLAGENAQAQRFDALSWIPANTAAQQNEKIKEDPVLAAMLQQAPYAMPQGQIHGSWWDIAKGIAANLKSGGESGIRSALDAYTDSLRNLLSTSHKAS